jgi:hypothetical protein
VDSQQWFENLETEHNVNVEEDNITSLKHRYQSLCIENLELFTDNQTISAEKREVEEELRRACAEIARMRNVMRRLGQELIEESYSM